MIYQKLDSLRDALTIINKSLFAKVQRYYHEYIKRLDHGISRKLRKQARTEISSIRLETMKTSPVTLCARVTNVPIEIPLALHSSNAESSTSFTAEGRVVGIKTSPKFAPAVSHHNETAIEKQNDQMECLKQIAMSPIRQCR
jgi:hypothetical protein